MSGQIGPGTNQHWMVNYCYFHNRYCACIYQDLWQHKRRSWHRPVDQSYRISATEKEMTLKTKKGSLYTFCPLEKAPPSYSSQSSRTSALPLCTARTIARVAGSCYRLPHSPLRNLSLPLIHHTPAARSHKPPAKAVTCTPHCPCFSEAVEGEHSVS